MSLSMTTTEQQITEYQRCIDHFTKVRSRFDGKRRTNRRLNKRDEFPYYSSIRYFDDRIKHYKTKIKELEKWQ